MENRILLVDDESSVLTALGRSLFEEPLEIVTATSAEDALQIMAEGVFKVVVSDERMPGMQGSEFLEQVRERYPETVRIMLTGHATLEAAMNAVNRGEIYRFFPSPGMISRSVLPSGPQSRSMTLKRKTAGCWRQSSTSSWR